ncbi:MAG: hypothetical protein FWD60_12455 [Candidatus Azobacteroides sp.]|nr:hypothetical protein [Candidatus Azobacteroides sp.]
MAKSNSMLGNTNKEGSVELFILDALLRGGGNVVIPDIGHLELKTLGERRTVLFKSEDSNDSFLRIVPATGDEKEKRGMDALYNNVSIPLKEGKIVNLPQVGVFTPRKRENGDTFISFMLSSSLRNLLNTEGETKKDVKDEEFASEIKETLNNQENKDEPKPDGIIIPKTDEVEKAGAWKSERVSLLPNNDKSKDNNISSKIKHESSFSTRRTQVVETVQEEAGKKPRSRNISGILLALAIIIFIVIIVVAAIHSRHNKNIEEQMSLASSSEKIGESVDLTTLAEQHYGNSAFWIYIYEANMDKLSSPINVPQNVSLTIPDLKTEYNVDVTDSGAIKNANKLAAIILEKGKDTNK